MQFSPKQGRGQTKSSEEFQMVLFNKFIRQLFWIRYFEYNEYNYI